jgi:hypothetical protein
MAKADLSDVTLCAAGSSNIGLTVRAMHHSLERCKFADAVLFTHSPPLFTDGFRTVTIPTLDRDGYQSFRLKPPPTVETPFTLFIEWDGYVLEPRAWHSRFREYDYIGARWQFEGIGIDGMNVGNSGFCLQSRKMYDALADARFQLPPGEFVDIVVCRTYRPVLEREFGIRFASPSVADLFSYEYTLPAQPTFGFHGLGNMYRYLSDDELVELCERADPYVLRSRQFGLLIANLAMQCKFALMERLYALMRKHIGSDDIVKLFRLVIRQPHADAMLGLCEKLVNMK